MRLHMHIVRTQMHARSPPYVALENIAFFGYHHRPGIVTIPFFAQFPWTIPETNKGKPRHQLTRLD